MELLHDLLAAWNFRPDLYYMYCGGRCTRQRREEARLRDYIFNFLLKVLLSKSAKVLL